MACRFSRWFEYFLVCFARGWAEDCMGISEAAGISAQRVQSSIETAVLSKVMQVVKGQQQAAAGLIDAALETARAIGGAEPGKGGLVDVTA